MIALAGEGMAAFPHRNATNAVASPETTYGAARGVRHGPAPGSATSRHFRWWCTARGLLYCLNPLPSAPTLSLHQILKNRTLDVHCPVFYRRGIPPGCGGFASAVLAPHRSSDAGVVGIVIGTFLRAYFGVGWTKLSVRLNDEDGRGRPPRSTSGVGRGRPKGLRARNSLLRVFFH